MGELTANFCEGDCSHIILKKQTLVSPCLLKDWCICDAKKLTMTVSVSINFS